MDSGISDKLKRWVIGKSDLLDPAHQALEHGTFIGGLLVAGRTLNSEAVVPEGDGCGVYDGAIFPNKDVAGALSSYYPLWGKGLFG